MSKIEKDFNRSIQSNVTIVLTNNYLAISRFFLLFIGEKIKLLTIKPS